MIDLHLHSNMSDGSDSPLELLEKAVAAGCKVISVTDHDDLRANAAIFPALKEGKYAVKLITGCEISAIFNGKNLHMLCYGFNPEANSIKALISEGAKLRVQRIAAIIEHLSKKHGIVIPKAEQADILSRAIPGKVHIADAAMKIGVTMSRKEFFNNCLDDMDSREFKIPAEKVIETAANAGGIVSIAHPVEIEREYRMELSELKEIIKQLKDKGLAAIEVFHSLHGEAQVNSYKKIAQEAGLLISGGSDYHGKNKTVKIGQLTSYHKMPDDSEITILTAL